MAAGHGARQTRAGFVLTEPKGMILREVSACDGGGLSVDLGVQALDLAHMTLKCTRVGGNLGGVLVLHVVSARRAV